MKEEIKELRVKIDGLAQLVKSMTGRVFAINTSAIPDNLDIDTFIKKWKENSNFMVPMKPLESSVESIHNYELSKTYDSLILAKAWLGKILGELGESTPYTKDGQRKTVQDIEPTADSVRILEIEKDYIADKKWSEMNHIEKVDWLREEIKNIIDTTTDFSQELPEIELEQGFVYKYLSEARFWLGFELQRIRENESR